MNDGHPSPPVLTPKAIAARCGIQLLDELAAGDLDGAADFLLVHDTTAGTRKKYKPAGLPAALNLVTAANAFGADNRLVRSDGTGRGAQASGITIDDSDNVTIPGNLTVQGTTITFDTETITVEDPLIKLAKANSGDLLDIGVYGLYNDGTARYAGLFRDASDGKFRLFKNLTAEPTTTVNIGDGSFQLAPLVLGDLTADAMVGDALVLGTDPTGSELLRVGGAIKLGSVTVYTSHALTSSTQGDMLKWAELGYGNYSALKLGIPTHSIALGVDIAGIAGGNFSGNGTEIFVNRNVSFLQPNAGSTDWEKAAIVFGGIRIGADPGGSEELRITGAIHLTGVIKGDNTTDATSSTDTSAAINTAGGLAVAKKAIIGTSIGIGGVTSPARPLDVYGSGQFKDTSGIATTVWSEAVSGAGGLGTNSNHPFVVLTNGAEVCRWSVGGVMSILNTTDAANKDTGAIVCEGGIAAEKDIFSGATLNAVTSLKINGTKVIGAQGAAVADVSTADATDLTTVIALANALKSTLNTALGRFRTHGLIAT